MTKWICCCLLLAGIASCRNPAAVDADDDRTVICDAPGEIAMDPLTIVGALVTGDALTLVVRYGGGCEEHAFALFGCEASMPTRPPGVPMRLAHDANGDACEALVTDTLRFSLLPVRHAWSGGDLSKSGSLRLTIAPPATSSSEGTTVDYRF